MCVYCCWHHICEVNFNKFPSTIYKTLKSWIILSGIHHEKWFSSENKMVIGWKVLNVCRNLLNSVRVSTFMAIKHIYVCVSSGRRATDKLSPSILTKLSIANKSFMQIWCLTWRKQKLVTKIPMISRHFMIMGHDMSSQIFSLINVSSH